jgi:hypothetical protein
MNSTFFVWPERERERENCIICPSPIYGFWLPLWNLKIISYIHAKNVYRITRMCFNYLSQTDLFSIPLYYSKDKCYVNQYIFSKCLWFNNIGLTIFSPYHPFSISPANWTHFRVVPLLWIWNVLITCNWGRNNKMSAIDS